MTAPNVSGWRPAMGEGHPSGAGRLTASGDRGLMLEEPLIFELGQPGTCGVDFDGAFDGAGEAISPGTCAPRRQRCRG